MSFEEPLPRAALGEPARSKGPDPPAERAAFDALGDGVDAANRPGAIVLPTLNEEDGLLATLQEIERVRREIEGRLPPVLVVDGGSTDGTVAIARSFGCPVLRQTGIGKGEAVREAIACAAARGVRSVGVLDADGTYPADRLPALFRLLDLGYELVIGVRRPEYAAHRTARDTVHRIGNGLLNVAAARLAGAPLLDVCSGFWGVRTEIVPSLGLRSTGFEIESEIFVKSLRARRRVVQIPIVYRERIGEAKLRAARDGVRIFLSIVRSAGSAPAPVVPIVPEVPRPLTTAELAARPVGAQRALTALLLTLDPGEVRFISPRRRRREAIALARELDPSRTEVEIASGPGAGGSARPPLPSGDRAGQPAVIVTLMDGPSRAPAPVALDVPSDGLHVWLGPRSADPGRAAERSEGPAGEAKGLGRSPGPGLLEVARAVFDPTGRRRERVLVHAQMAEVRRHPEDGLDDPWERDLPQRPRPRFTFLRRP